MNLCGREFDEVVLVDFEFHQPPGERPAAICMVAAELSSGRVHRLFGAELRSLTRAPFRTDARTLLVAFYATAETSCFLALGWPMPMFVLDLFTEFRSVTNGRRVPCGNGLLGALAYFGIDAADSQHKVAMRELAIRGEPFTADERQQLLTYCESDVVALSRLLPRIAPLLDGDRSLLRGEYMSKLAMIEAAGIPIDREAFEVVSYHWEKVRTHIISLAGEVRDFFDGATFKTARFERWLADRGIEWPRSESGQLRLDEEAFEDMSSVAPSIPVLASIRNALAKLRSIQLPIGSDGRARCMLSAFQSKTGRNQPPNSKFVFGMPAWMRGFIQTRPGRALAYLDWNQQEFGIAAGLSGDPAMRAAYRSRDPYLEFAKLVKAAPPNATRESHTGVRDQFKACVLAVQYGMGSKKLARRIGRPEPFARELLDLHRKTFSKFWEWSDELVDRARLEGRLETVFGWRLHIGKKVSDPTLRNFPMQANGAEMLRLACCYAIDRGVTICAPVHDAILIEAPESEISARVEVAQECLRQASRDVLGDFELSTDAKITRFPERLLDGRGARMWAVVRDVAVRLDGEVKEGRT